MGFIHQKAVVNSVPAERTTVLVALSAGELGMSGDVTGPVLNGYPLLRDVV